VLRRIVAADPHARVMPLDVRVVLDVPAPVQLVVIGQPLVEIDGGDALPRGHRHRLRAADLVGDELHARLALYLLVAVGDLRDRRELEVLEPHDRRVVTDPDIAGILVREPPAAAVPVAAAIAADGAIGRAAAATTARGKPYRPHRK